jgi:hypothetical protein
VDDRAVSLTEIVQAIAAFSGSARRGRSRVAAAAGPPLHGAPGVYAHALSTPKAKAELGLAARSIRRCNDGLGCGLLDARREE